ncbi:MAG: AbrB/MazE/SpoVT family DNA-binding domain-containing protein [Nanoarchaeota archaeon]|nr:AbrB/MazE/SpoVT family DNA-binding domain-containing protein [Nanoarchaeota archaeon]
MQRKLAKIGPSTLMISIPSAWAKQHQLSKGDLIEIQPHGKTLTLTLEKTNKEKSITINAEHLNTMLNRTIGACYKKGYTTVKIVFPDHASLVKHYDHLTQSWTGMEVLEQTPTTTTMKQISPLQEEDYQSLLNRTFLFLIATSHEAYEAAKNNNQDMLNHITQRDKTQNKYCDICRRILNTNHISHSNAHYYIVEQLERIGDFYRDLSKHLHKTKNKITKEHLQLYEKINQYLQDFYHLHNKFNHKNYEQFGNTYQNLKKELQELQEQGNKHDTITLSHLHMILESIFDTNGAEAIINLEEP